MPSVQPAEALLIGIQQPVPFSESVEAVSQDCRQDLVGSVLQTDRPAVAHFKQIAFLELWGNGELTGFSPRIDWIFPSSTSKRFSKGWGLGFRAEILGVG